MGDQVREVKEKTDIVTIVGEHVTLKKAGRHYKGLCPFHNEKSPSFTVSPELQMYKCFGCGESGDVFTFLEKYEGLEFPDVLKILADRVGVKLIPFKGQENSHKDIFFEVNEVASKYYHYILLNSPAGKPFLDYLTKTRGLKKETIEAFVIGAAPDSPHALFDFLTKKKGYKPDVVLEAGLVYRTDQGAYVDRFRGRVIFPIQNARGVAVALAGRILPTLPRANSLAKYINSPETPIYHKSDSLFGISQAREAIKRSGIAIVVEGEVDMISPWQEGIKNIVAIKGSALTESHAKILSRLASTAILALDSDFAGNNAAIKGIALAQDAGLTVKVASLGKYKDPDEFAKADPKGFKAALEKAQGVWDFIIDTFFARFDGTTAEGKTSISRELLPHLTHITDSILRAHYERLIANRLNVPEEAVAKAMAAALKKQDAPVIVTEKVTIPLRKSRRDLLEERLFALGSLTDAKLLLEPEAKGYLKSHHVSRILGFLEEYLKTNEFTPQDFAMNLPNELKDNFLQSVLLDEEAPINLKGEFDSVLYELRELTLKSEISELSSKIKELDISEKESEILAIQRKIGELTNMLAQKK